MPPAARTPAIDPLVALADRCVQCGLCLPACPTYARDRQESESPRGRIALARAWALATIKPTAAGDAHLDHCLACRRCETVCPAGVQYGELLLAARAVQRQRRPPVWQQRAIEALSARPRLLAAVLRGYRLAHPWLPRRWRPLPRTPARQAEPRVATEPRTVALFTGCVARPYEVATRHALSRLCAAAGVAVAAPLAQTCCGSVHAHAGDRDRAQRLAALNREAFGAADTVLTLASGCHESLVQSLPGATVVDALSFLADHAAALRFDEHRERVALHLPCTQRHAVKSVPALRRLLARVPGLQVVELDAGHGCCGAAGTAMLTDRARADHYRQPLLTQLSASGASRVLSANIGCRLHLGKGTALPVQHPLEFLAQVLAPGTAGRS
ncbi:(Fe-S)-binding protein [Lysobacter koreensis]|uniref:Glycolate oxidase iron-sulfur subunit n=1 Tax=Lysobacter koreensis TaxID=266122 RepID=A0ABW2YME1_9GAMM